MHVIKPNIVEPRLRDIAIGKCFLFDGIVFMRISVNPPPEGTKSWAVNITTGIALTLNLGTNVTPVNMTAVESDL